MEEKDIRYTPEAHISDALHPEIGNGAALSNHTHSAALRLPDPTKALEQLLPNNTDSADHPEYAITSATETTASDRNTVDSTPDAAARETTSASSEATPAVIPTDQDSLIEKNKSDIEVIKQTKKTDKKDGVGQAAKESKHTAKKKVPAKKAPKPGKRIRKAAKAVQQQQKDKKKKITKSAGKKTTRKATSKKSASTQATTKKAPVRKTTTKKVSAKQSTQPKATKKTTRDKGHTYLSPFTQWLKDLGGADYVHPYDDDFALKQEKGALNEVISETYANLLATQGYKDRAIDMYLKLIEKYPEKSSFFAAKIEALQ